MPVPIFRLVETVERPHEAHLLNPGDAALVFRDGVTRALAMSCPDGCGEIITINLDSRAGKAWILYRGPGGLTLYPSVWRETGCKAHFIVWDDCILGIGIPSSRSKPTVDRSLPDRVFAALPSGRFVPYWEIAESLEANPWAVEWSCQQLVERWQAECQGAGNLASRFRRRA